MAEIRTLRTEEPYAVTGYEIQSRTIPRRVYQIPLRVRDEPVGALFNPVTAHVVWDVVAGTRCVATFTDLDAAATYVQQQVEAEEGQTWPHAG